MASSSVVVVVGVRPRLNASSTRRSVLLLLLLPRRRCSCAFLVALRRRSFDGNADDDDVDDAEVSWNLRPCGWCCCEVTRRGGVRGFFGLRRRRTNCRLRRVRRPRFKAARICAFRNNACTPWSIAVGGIVVVVQQPFERGGASSVATTNSCSRNVHAVKATVVVCAAAAL